MAFAFTRSDVKRLCRITTTDYDSDIDALIAEQKAVIEYSISSRYVNATNDAGLQATLNLGALEVTAGEFLAMLAREEASLQQIRIGDIVIGNQNPIQGKVSVNDPYGLKSQGRRRLLPFLKPDVIMQGDTGVKSDNEEIAFTEEELNKW